jgi:hypothetical protein
MRSVTASLRRLVPLLAALTTAGVAAIAAAPAAAAGGTSGCNPYVDGTVIPVPCSSGFGTTGGGGASVAARATVKESCVPVVLDGVQAQALGLPLPPPIGQDWALLQCGISGGFPEAVLVVTVSRAAIVTPRELLQTALGELRVPALAPSTAPPRGRPGLVGLPEWFWIPAASWRPRTVTVSVGAVWATVTAMPVGLTFEPGTGISSVTCDGPGTAYARNRPAASQHSACTYTYRQPSVDLRHDAYDAAVAVTWRVSWTGSSGAGGLLDAALAVPVAFSLSVAQGEALVTGQ